MTAEDRYSFISGICTVAGAGVPSERVAAARDLIESSCRLGEAIESPKNPYKGTLITFSAIGLGLAFLNAVACSRRNYW